MHKARQPKWTRQTFRFATLLKQLATMDEDGQRSRQRHEHETHFTYQHEKESIPANVPVSMEVTHFCCHDGSRDPTPSTIPWSWSTSTKSSKIRTTHGHHSRPAPVQACPCPSPCPWSSLPCPAPCMAQTCIALLPAHACPFPWVAARSCPCLWPSRRPSLQCPEQWCARAVRQQHLMSSQQHPSLPPLMRCRCPGAWPVALALPFALSGLGSLLKPLLMVRRAVNLVVRPPAYKAS